VGSTGARGRFHLSQQIQAITSGIRDSGESERRTSAGKSERAAEIRINSLQKNAASPIQVFANTT
jgi:hypothetical protein